MRFIQIWEQTDNVFLLIIKLYKEFFVWSSPNSNSSILSTGKDIVCVDVYWSYRSSMSVCHLPNDISLCVEAPDETVSPSSNYGVIIQSDAAWWALDHLACSTCEYCFIFWKIPDLGGSVFINGQKLVWSLWREMKVVNWSSMGISV